MSQNVLSDPELGGKPGGPDDRGNQNTTTSNQPLKGESNFGDSSGPLFNIYSKAAEEEDNKMVEHWQKDADGILFFTGLFSASVAALLAFTVQDLRPNSQDTSAFYLGNIYQVLADPNVTRTSIPSPDAKPPPFSPSRYAVWVNTLWFLSLVMSLSCALWATSLQQWARRYLRRAQLSRCHPEQRARMRAFFANGVDKMHIPWAVEGLPTLLHLSLFLFFGGLAIFLFDIDREVFKYVIWWIGFFFLVYIMITLLPFIRLDSPYNSPLTTPVWFLYTTTGILTFYILTVIVMVCTLVCRLPCLCCPGLMCINIADPVRHCMDLCIWSPLRYFARRSFAGELCMPFGCEEEEAAEDTASKRSSKIAEIDLQILDWTISTLGDDDSLKSFFEAIPGFFDSKLVNHLEREFSWGLVNKLQSALCGFVCRTCTSTWVDDSEKLRRLDISLAASKRIMHNASDRDVRHNLLNRLPYEGPRTVEMGHILARWLKNDGGYTHASAQGIFAKILVTVRERNDSWIRLAARVFDLPERDVWDYTALEGDSVLLSIFIHVTRRKLRSYYRISNELTKFDIRNTHPRVQHDFCTLWNEIVQEARKQGPRTNPVLILFENNHLYVPLHQGTDAAMTAITSSTSLVDLLYDKPSSYPLCNIVSHRPDSTPGNPSDALSPPPTDGDNTASPQAEQVNNVTPPTTSEVGATVHGHNITLSINTAHSSSRLSSGSSTPVVAHALMDITSIATLSHPLETSDMVAPTAGPGTSQISSTAYTHAPTSSLVLIPTSLPNTLSESDNAGAASVTNASRFAPPFIGSIPAYNPTGSDTLPHLRPRGLVNIRKICFANAVLQLLVNSPPFSNLFRELDDLKAQRGVGVPDTGGGAKPLVGATVRFFKEFLVGEESPSTQQQSQLVRGETSKANDEKKGGHTVDPFEPKYFYDAMKEKQQLKPLLDGQQQDAEEFLSLYLDALDEELYALLSSTGDHQSATSALKVDEREVSQPDQTEVESRAFVANFDKSPITHIFGGKFRLPVCTPTSPSQPNLVPTEDWRLLHLDIQYDSIHTVQGALAQISQPQSVQVGASSLSNASQQVLIDTLPPVLVLHLNRVRYDAAAGGMTKIGKFIQLAPELEIPLDIMVPNAQRPTEPPRYKLYGVLYHHGESAGSGHYTVDVLHQNGDSDTGEVWLNIDDETVSPVRLEDVFGEHGTERVADDRCAYLLFYCHTSPIVTVTP